MPKVTIIFIFIIIIQRQNHHLASSSPKQSSSDENARDSADLDSLRRLTACQLESGSGCYPSEEHSYGISSCCSVLYAWCYSSLLYVEHLRGCKTNPDFAVGNGHSRIRWPLSISFRRRLASWGVELRGLQSNLTAPVSSTAVLCVASCSQCEALFIACVIAKRDTHIHKDAIHSRTSLRTASRPQHDGASPRPHQEEKTIAARQKQQ